MNLEKLDMPVLGKGCSPWKRDRFCSFAALTKSRQLDIRGGKTDTAAGDGLTGSTHTHTLYLQLFSLKGCTFHCT